MKELGMGGWMDVLMDGSIESGQKGIWEHQVASVVFMSSVDDDWMDEWT